MSMSKKMFRKSNPASASSASIGAGSKAGGGSKASRHRNSTSSLEAIAAYSGALPSTFTDGLPLPKMFVFDLDYTLWPFWVDTHVSPPLKANEGGAKVKDSLGEVFRVYDDVPNILAGLRTLSIKVAAASRTQAPELAREMLRLLKMPSKPVDHLSHPMASKSTTSSSSNTTSPVTATTSGSTSSTTKALEFFDYMQIYPGSKIRHFESLLETTDIPFEEMLFFDDEARNREVEQLGVVMWLVRDGVSHDEVDKGVLSWRKRNRREVN